MENNITDLFADSPSKNSKGPTGRTGNPGVAGNPTKSPDLKSSAMNEAMKLMSNPKRLKGIIIALVAFLLIGVGATISFFVIYPIAIVWAICSYSVLFMINWVARFIKA